MRDLERIHDDGKVPPAVAIQATLRSMAQAYDVVRRAVAEAEAEHNFATEKRREAMIARELPVADLRLYISLRCN